ncbi:MAG: hypothetical protein ACW99A_03415 [Candidatus Kariarchaeaceae archaeon]|jgi:ribose/xylose/arabinose/galactoside ABC-type transport system permease subunit
MVRDKEQTSVITYICALFCWPFGLIKWAMIREKRPNAAQSVLIITIVGFIIGGGYLYTAEPNIPSQ